MRTITQTGVLAACLAACALWGPAQAEQHGGPAHVGGGRHLPPGYGVHRDFGHGNFGYRAPVPYRHIPPAPYWGVHWNEGRWYHGYHDHHHGWWWIVGGGWFWFSAPIYPYPDFYVPPGVIATAPPAQYWYWCDAPAGYYPYVTACTVPWKLVAATPPPAPPGY